MKLTVTPKADHWLVTEAEPGDLPARTWHVQAKGTTFVVHRSPWMGRQKALAPASVLHGLIVQAIRDAEVTV
jgi:hypothetical protein